jgi:hypothetical protein
VPAELPVKLPVTLPVKSPKNKEAILLTNVLATALLYRSLPDILFTPKMGGLSPAHFYYEIVGLV